MAETMFAAQPGPRAGVVLDIGGEGRYPGAWNVNPSPVKTVGKDRGEPIPRHIFGRADCIPFEDGSVERVIVERTPVRVAALHEIARVVARGGTIVLRHARPPTGDPHALARRILPGRIRRRVIHLDGQVLQETEFRLSSGRCERQISG